MSGLFAMLLPQFTIGALLLAALIFVPRRRKLVAIDAPAFPALVRLRNVTLIARLIGVVVGIVAIVAVANAGRLGIGVLLAPAVFAATQILATLAAGVITHNAARTPGVAGLEVRNIRTYLPMGLTTVVASVTALLTVVLVWTTAVASTDDMGRAGRQFQFSYPCDGDAYGCSSAFGPFPGSFYTVPLAIVLAVTLLIAAMTIIVTVRRPRNASDPEILRVDDVVRSRSVESVIAAVGVATSGSLFASSFLIGSGLGFTRDYVPADLHVIGVSATVIAGLSLLMMSWCVVVLLLPGARAARTEPGRLSATTSAGAR